MTWYYAELRTIDGSKVLGAWSGKDSALPLFMRGLEHWESRGMTHRDLDHRRADDLGVWECGNDVEGAWIIQQLRNIESALADELDPGNSYLLLAGDW